ncbi:TRAP transporter large permease subunit [Neomoorella humiferrea]|uniref:TRAP transporter large permease n=1 Tax=Neomoorella humiferrea TaxID=676965 RepID=UPI003D8B312E
MSFSEMNDSMNTEGVINSFGKSLVADLLASALEITTGILLITDVIVVGAAVIWRYILLDPMPWADEVARLLLIWLTFFGGCIALKRHSHMNMDAIVSKLPDQWRCVIDGIVQIIQISFLVFLAIKGYELVIVRLAEPSPALLISMGWFIAPVPLCAIIMVIWMAMDIYTSIRKDGLRALIGIIAGAIIIGIAVSGVSLFQSINPLIILMLVSFLLILLGTPIAFSLGAASLAYLLLKQQTPVIIVPQRMVAGVDSFALLALPFFILAGNLMESGGISERLVNFASALVGHLRGGLGQVAVVTEILFSGISGSASADVSAVGSMLIPPMERAGYKRVDSAAIISAACAMGVLVPPMIWMVVIGAYFNISIIAIFVGSILPALTLAIPLMILIYLLSRRENWPSGPRLPWGERLKATTNAIIPLMMPVVIFGTIRGGVVTVTEGAAVAVFYAIIVGLIIYREVSIKELIKHFVEAGVTSGMILWLIGAASIFSWVLAHELVPATIGMWITNLTDSRWIFLVLSVLIFMILGGILEGLPAILILAPIFIPIAGKLGINMVHYSVVIIGATGIGIFVPPVGVGAFIACTIARIDVITLAKRYLPYLLVLICALLVVTFIPAITLILPTLLLK